AKPNTNHLSPITYHLSPITYHLSPITYHLSQPPRSVDKRPLRSVSANECAAQVTAVSLDAPEQQDGAHDHRDRRVAPRVAAYKCCRHRQHPKPDERFSPTVAIVTRALPPLRRDNDVVRRPRVENETDPDESDESAQQEWKGL